MTGARVVTALGAWLVPLIVLVGPASSEPPAWFSVITPKAIVDALPGVDPRRPVPVEERIIPALVDPDLPLLTTSAVDRQSTDLRLLTSEAERWRLMEVGAAVTLRSLDAKVTAFGQLPYALIEPAGATALDEFHEPAALSVTARVGDFEAGAQYRSVGKRLERLIRAPAAFRDREGREVWVAQRFGVLRLRLADSELTDNVDRNPALPRTTKDQTAITAEVAWPEWPALGLTLATGDSTRTRLTRDRQDGTPERHEFESVTGSAYYYGGRAWSVSASSTFSRSRGVAPVDDDMAMTYHDLSLTIHPHESVTVTPTLSLARERYEPSGLGIDTSIASLMLSYTPPASRWWTSSFVSYTTTRASDASSDARSLSVSGALTYSLARWLPGCSVSVEAGYDRYADGAVPASASRAVSGFVLLKLAAF